MEFFKELFASQLVSSNYQNPFKNISPLLHLQWASFHFSSGFNFYLKEFVIEKT